MKIPRGNNDVNDESLLHTALRKVLKNSNSSIVGIILKMILII